MATPSKDDLLVIALLPLFSFSGSANAQAFGGATSFIDRCPISVSSAFCCCDVLSQAGLSAYLSFPGSMSYENSVDSYFSVIEQEVQPECVLKPRSAAHVSTAIQTLVEADKRGNKCQFAVRSGGHTPWAGAANIENGVTIDLRDLNTVSYDATIGLTSAGGGATWDHIYLTVQKLGLMVVGGRSSTVGVGGLTLGGGNSFFSARMGLVCDNVRQHEIVLANGSIVIASATQNADLHKALKGGSSNFGIVTRFDLNTFPDVKLWGGTVLYPNSTAPQQFAALSKFGNNVVEDPYASAIVMNAYIGKLETNAILNAYEYTMPQPRPAMFQDFLAIPGNISDTMRITHMADLAEEFANPATFRVLFVTCTFKNDIRVLNMANELFNVMLANIKAKATGVYNLYALYQPISPAITRNSIKLGGNVLGLDRFIDETIILYQVYAAWTGAEQDDLFNTQGRCLNDKIVAYAKSIGADNPFIYLDYADATQHPLHGYGPENVEFLKNVASKYDPTGVFQTMMPGGFKISSAAP